LAAGLAMQVQVVPRLVAPELLSRAIAVSSSSMQLAMISGPAIGGLLYLAGSGVVYACSATLFLISAALMLAVVERRVRTVLPPLSLDYVFAGLRFIAGRPARKDSACRAPPPALGAIATALWLARHPLQSRVGRKMLVCHRCLRHVQCRHPPVAGAARDPGRHARAGQRSEQPVDRCLQPDR